MINCSLSSLSSCWCMKFDMHATKLQQVLKGISSEDEACSHAVQAPTARNRRQLMTAYRPGTDRQFGSILPVLAMNTAQVHTCSATPWIRQHVDNFIMQYHATCWYLCRLFRNGPCMCVCVFPTTLVLDIHLGGTCMGNWLHSSTQRKAIHEAFLPNVLSFIPEKIFAFQLSSWGSPGS